MRAGDLLRRLDSRLLPLLVGGMARLGQSPLRTRVATASTVASVAAVLVTVGWAADRQPVSDATVGEVVRVGVVEGQSIPGYVRSSRGELDAMLAEPSSGPAPTETYALVTLSAYLAPDRLAPVLAGAAVSEVFSRVPLPDTQTQIVRIPAFRLPADVVAGMAQVAERKDGEARDYRDRSGALRGDGDRERELRRIYETGADVAAAEAAAYRSRCSCVYAAIVRATAASLARIAQRPGVRAVDPAPEVRRLERAVFLPPLPEQAEVARPPADGGLPAPGASEAGAGPPASPSSGAVPDSSPATVDAPAASTEPSPAAPPTEPPPTGPALTTAPAGP